MNAAKPQLSKSLLLWALVLRLVVSAFFFHPDIKSQHFHAQFLSRGVIDIYTHISVFGKSLPYRDTFNYPPLAYYFLGTWNLISQNLLGPQLLTWLNDWGPGNYTHPHLFEMLLILKFPYLILDFWIGFLLLKINSSPTSSHGLLAFWFFNPVSLYAVYMLSQFDIVCAFLTVAALLQIKKRQLFSAALLLGLGAMLKSYPLLLLPFVLFRATNIKQLLAAKLGFLVGFIVPVIPVISSPAFRYTMSHSNLMQRVFEAGIDIGGGQKLPLFILIYVFSLWLSWKRRKNSDLLPEFLTTTLSVLLVSHFHAQWVVWSLPFISLLFARLPRQLLPLTLAAALGYFVTNILIVDQYAFLGLFSPINPVALALPPFPEIISLFVNPVLLQSLAHTLLTGTGLWVIYLAWNTRSYE